MRREGQVWGRCKKIMRARSVVRVGLGGMCKESHRVMKFKLGKM